MKEMHSITLIIVHVKNWPQRSKRFNQPLKSKIQSQTARADRLPYWPKLMQFRAGVHYTLWFARKTQPVCLQCLICVCICTYVRIRWNMNSHLISCAVWFWYLLYAVVFVCDKRSLFPRYHSAEIFLHWLCTVFWLRFVLKRISDQAGSGGIVMDNTLDYQPRDRKNDAPLLRSFGWDFKPRSRLHMTPLSFWSGCVDMFLDLLSLHHTFRSSNATRAEQNSPTVYVSII